MKYIIPIIIFITLWIGGIIYYMDVPKEEVSVGSEIVLKTNDKQSYFAEVIGGEVKRVIVADQEFINSGAVGNPNNWKRTYKDGFERKNYAGKGYTYDEIRDAFIPPKPTIDAILDEETAKWNLPIKIITATTT